MQLLGAATEAAAPSLEQVRTRLLVGDAAALGLGAYAITAPSSRRSRSLPPASSRCRSCSSWSPAVRSRSWTEALATAVTTLLGPVPSVVLAVSLLFGSLRLFDRLLARVGAATIRRQFFSPLERTWLSFAIGLFVTGVTTSIAFSLGVTVPLYNRGYVERDELVPYVLGANLGTLFDPLVVAVDGRLRVDRWAFGLSLLLVPAALVALD